MATTEDLAPARSSTASSRANGNGQRRSSARKSRAREDDVERQIARLQDELKAIAGSISKLADSGVAEARHVAKAETKKLVDGGQQAIEHIQDEFGQMEKQIKDTIRQKPLTAVVGAIAVGFVLALVTR